MDFIIKIAVFAANFQRVIFHHLYLYKYVDGSTSGFYFDDQVEPTRETVLILIVSQ
jgi:hypothetical protein